MLARLRFVSSLTCVGLGWVGFRRRGVRSSVDPGTRWTCLFVGWMDAARVWWSVVDWCELALSMRAHTHTRTQKVSDEEEAHLIRWRGRCMMGWMGCIGFGDLDDFQPMGPTLRPINRIQQGSQSIDGRTGSISERGFIQSPTKAVRIQRIQQRSGSDAAAVTRAGPTQAAQAAAAGQGARAREAAMGEEEAWCGPVPDGAAAAHGGWLCVWWVSLDFL